MYPQEKLDKLGRSHRIDFSASERVFRTFWGDTNDLKVRYHVLGSEVKIDVYDTTGKLIMTNENGKFKISLPGFNINNYGYLSFRVLPKLTNDWRNILKKES